MTRPFVSLGLQLSDPRYENGEDWPVTYVYRANVKIKVGWGGAPYAEGMTPEAYDAALAQYIADDIKRTLDRQPEYLLTVARALIAKKRAGKHDARIPMMSAVASDKK